jgi:hypothetical protein
MGAAVSELAARVFVSVAEQVVAVAVERHAAPVALADFGQRPIRNLRRWVEPKVPVQPCGHSNRWDDGRRLREVLAKQLIEMEQRTEVLINYLGLSTPLRIRVTLGFPGG